MKKVLLISDVLEHYRLPLYNSLTTDVDLTIATQTSYNENLRSYKQHIISIKSKVGFIFYNNLPVLDDFDYVIFPFNVRLIFVLFKYLFAKRKFKIFVFGIGVAASYSKRYDQKNFFDFFRRIIIKTVDGAIFYEKYPEIKYSKYLKGRKCKTSVAYNTVAPNNNFKLEDKTFESFIFIGSLYKQKKIYDLLEAYFQYAKKATKILKLEIVGDGEEYDNIKRIITKKNMFHNIVLHGKINDDDKLIHIMNRAVACISPGQAGLSVQKCFSYGVPFITTKNAITGGELHSIINQVNGFFYEGNNLSELENLMLKISNDEIFIKNISYNAYFFYENYRNVCIWKKGFLENLI